MTSEEKNLIEGLFQRLRQADTNPKDPEAEQLIRAKTAELPSAPYLLVQAVLVQEHALANAQARIAELESRLQNAQAQPASGGGSFLSGVSRFFGNKPQSQASPPPVPQQAPVTHTGGMGGNTEIVNNYYGADQPAGSEHVQSDTGIQNADLPQDQDFSASDDRADLVDADSQDSGLDLGGGDDSGFASDDSFSGSDDNLV
jgi:hypothetical protein